VTGEGAGPWVFVPGQPQPKGSTTAFAYIPKGGGKPRASTTNANPETKGWEATVRDYVTPVLNDGLIPYPRPWAVLLELWFLRARTASAPKKSTPYLTVKPDIDKLQRAVLDALTGTLYADDAQVIGGTFRKRTCEAAERPGLWLRWQGIAPGTPERAFRPLGYSTGPATPVSFGPFDPTVQP
jgi:crossover junction endodeoxyribonuclease RusA